MSNQVDDIQTACKTLINHFKVVVEHYRASEEGSVFNDVTPLMDVVFETRQAPKKVTGVYEDPASYIRDVLKDYQERHGLRREEIPVGVLYSVGEAGHLMAYLLRRQFLIYSGLSKERSPEFYVGLTPDTTHCVAVSCRPRVALESV